MMNNIIEMKYQEIDNLMGDLPINKPYNPAPVDARRENNAEAAMPTLLSGGLSLNQNQVVLFEKFNADKVHYLQQYHRGDLKGKLASLEKFLHVSTMYVEDGGYHNKKVKYDYAEGATVGRLYSNGSSLQSLPKDVRAFVSGEFYTEVDISNAQPFTLKCLAQEQGLACSNLVKYCDNRDNLLDMYSHELGIERSQVKNMVLQLCFGIGERAWEHTHEFEMNPFLKDLKSEINDIANVFVKHTMFKHIIEGAKDSLERAGKGTNPFSYLSYILQEYEQRVSLHMKDYFQMKKMKVGSLIFDGILVEAKKISPKMMKGLCEYVKDKTGFSYSISEKPLVSKFPFDKNKMLTLADLKRLKDNPTDAFDHISKDIPVDFYKNDEVAVNNEVEGAEYVFEKNKDRIKYCNGIVYLRDGYIYKAIENDDIISIIMQYNIVVLTAKSSRSLSRTASGSKNIMAFLMPIIKRSAKDDDFFFKLFDLTMYKLPYNNGYYDFKQKEFVKWEDNVNNVCFTQCINKDYNPTKNHELRKEIYKRVLKPIFPDKEMRDFVIKTISRAMAGCVEDKLWNVFIGSRDSGKGVILELLENSFKKFVKTTHSENFLVDKSDDMAKKLKFLIPCQFSRILATSEMSLSKGKLDGNIIKKICSGGDTLTARMLHKNEIDFKIQTTLFLMCNDIVEPDADDVKEKCSTIEMPSKFVSEDLVGKQAHYKLEDCTIKKWIKTDDVITEFTHIIFDAFEDVKPDAPECVLDDRIAETECNDDTWLYDQFKYGNDLFITSTNMTKYLKELHACKKTFNVKKMRLMLRQKQDVAYKAKLLPDGRIVKCWCGLGFNEDCDED